MAVQKNKKSRSKSGMRRAHTKIKSPELVQDSVSGQFSMRHHVAADGTYRGKQYIVSNSVVDTEEEVQEG